MASGNIDERIAKAEEEVVKAKARYDETVKVLEALMAKKKALQTEELMRLFANSNKTYEEVAEFLKSGMTEEDIAKVARKNRAENPSQRLECRVKTKWLRAFIAFGAIFLCFIFDFYSFLIQINKKER